MFRKVIFKNIIWENASLNLRISYVRGSILIIIIIYHSSNKVYKSDNNKSDNNRRYNTTKEEHPNRKKSYLSTFTDVYALESLGTCYKVVR